MEQEQLDAIRERDALPFEQCTLREAREDRRALLAKVERLQTERGELFDLAVRYKRQRLEFKTEVERLRGQVAAISSLVAGADRLSRCGEPHWLDICEHPTTEYALVSTEALAALAEPVEQEAGR